MIANEKTIHQSLCYETMAHLIGQPICDDGF